MQKFESLQLFSQSFDQINIQECFQSLTKNHVYLSEVANKALKNVILIIDLNITSQGQEHDAQIIS